MVQKFGSFKKTPYLCTAFQKKGRLAQLVYCGISFYLCFCLEVELTSDAEYTIGSCEAVADARRRIVVAVVILVVRLEISCRDGDVITNLVVETETDAIAIDDERHIVHVFVGDSVACELSTARHVQLGSD